MKCENWHLSNVFHVAGTLPDNLHMLHLLLEKMVSCLLLSAKFYISETIKGLMFYPTCSLVTQPGTASEMLTEDMSLWDQRQWILLPRSRQYELPSSLPLIPHKGDLEGSVWTLDMQWVSLTAEDPQAQEAPVFYNGLQTCSNFSLKGKGTYAIRANEQIFLLFQRDTPSGYSKAVHSASILEQISRAKAAFTRSAQQDRDKWRIVSQYYVW